MPTNISGIRIHGGEEEVEEEEEEKKKKKKKERREKTRPRLPYENGG
jgi:hypothetical protein